MLMQRTANWSIIHCQGKVCTVTPKARSVCKSYVQMRFKLIGARILKRKPYCTNEEFYAPCCHGNMTSGYFDFLAKHSVYRVQSV